YPLETNPQRNSYATTRRQVGPSLISSRHVDWYLPKAILRTVDGEKVATNFFWQHAAEKHAIPYAEVYLRDNVIPEIWTPEKLDGSYPVMVRRNWRPGFRAC
ncbi:MAG: hypothetical protein HN348_29055, partial [Proteobacteria bacterium]|nr:hypothetical protein [Pseudomonadota bacterium]